MKKDEFLLQLQKILDLFDKLDIEIEKADKMCDEQPEQKSEIDKLLSDYLHIIENEKLDEKGYKRVGEKIHEARLVRRDQEWLFNLVRAYQLNKNKLIISPKVNREMFRGIIEKTLKGLDTTYNYRILSEDDVNEITHHIEKPRTKFDLKKIQELLDNGEKMVDIAEQMHTTQPQISRLCKKFGLKRKKQC